MDNETFRGWFCLRKRALCEIIKLQKRHCYDRKYSVSHCKQSIMSQAALSFGTQHHEQAAS